MTNENIHPSHQPALSAAEHSRGTDDAALTLLEYGDYACPICSEAEPVLLRLVDKFGKRMRFVYRHFPLNAIHPDAELAAEAAEAAAAQGKFWDMHQLLFTHHNHLKLSDLAHYAEQLELNMSRFYAEMADRVYLQRVQEHRHAAQKFDLQSTPSFFLNNYLIDVASGWKNVEQDVYLALDVKFIPS